MTIHFSTLTNTDMSNAGYAAFVGKLMAEAGCSAAVAPVDKSGNKQVSGTITFNGTTYTLPGDATQWTWQPTVTVAWDDDAGVLAVYSNRTPTESTSNTSNDRYASCYVYVLIAGGHLWWGSGPHDRPIANAFNVGTGTPRAAADTTRAMLTPLIADGIDMTPVFVSQNFVIDTAGTTVTDTAGNKFVSLGNLLYIRDTAASESAGTAVTCRVGSVSTLPAGSSATVTNSGTLNDIILDFAIPQGAAGVQGPKGDQGERGLTGLQGPKGDDGEASGGIPQGAIVFVYSGSPLYRALWGSDEWIESGSFLIKVDKPIYDTGGNPTPNDTTTGQTRRLYMFAKA